MLLFEKAFFFICVMHYSAAIVPLLITGGSSEGDNIPMASFNWAPSSSLYLLTYCISFLLLTFRWKRVLSSMRIRDFLLPLLVLFAPLTTLWSLTPDETISSAIALIGTTVLGFYFASRFTVREQLRLLGWSFVLILILSFLFIVLMPQYGIEHGVHAGAFRGVFTHKNTFGKFLVLSVILFLTLVLVEKPKNIAVFRFGLVMSFVLLPLSRSSSSFLNACFLAVLAFLLYRILHFKVKVLIPSVILIILSIWAFSFISQEVAETFAGFFGKDLTLTGRTEIWGDVIKKIQERPLQGYGFSSFWAQSPEDILRTFGWLPPNAHNGFLDLALDLGITGLLLYCLISLRILVKSFFLSRRIHIDSEAFWPSIFFMFTLLTNLTESGLFGRNSIYPLLFISLYFSFFFFPKGPAFTSSKALYPSISQPRLREILFQDGRL